MADGHRFPAGLRSDALRSAGGLPRPYGDVFPPRWRRPPPAALRYRTSPDVIVQQAFSDGLTCWRAALQRSRHADAEAPFQHAGRHFPRGPRRAVPDGIRDEAAERLGPLGGRSRAGIEARLAADGRTPIPQLAATAQGGKWPISHALARLADSMFAFMPWRSRGGGSRRACGGSGPDVTPMTAFRAFTARTLEAG